MGDAIKVVAGKRPAADADENRRRSALANADALIAELGDGQQWSVLAVFLRNACGLRLQEIEQLYRDAHGGQSFSAGAACGRQVMRIARSVAWRKTRPERQRLEVNRPGSTARSFAPPSGEEIRVLGLDFLRRVFTEEPELRVLETVKPTGWRARNAQPPAARDQEVAQMKDQGMTNRQIAGRLGVSAQRVGQLLARHAASGLSDERSVQGLRPGADEQGGNG